MKCLYCGGTLKRGRVSYAVNRNGYHLIVDNVPARVCQQCGEALFDEQTVEAIQVVLRELDSKVETLLAEAA
jgi:YgiT-type zinc finger domain-containing protein